MVSLLQSHEFRQVEDVQGGVVVHISQYGVAGARSIAVALALGRPSAVHAVSEEDEWLAMMHENGWMECYLRQSDPPSYDDEHQMGAGNEESGAACARSIAAISESEDFVEKGLSRSCTISN